MSTSKIIEKFFIENGFKKEKMDSCIAYSKSLEADVEYLFIYVQSKSKYHSKGAPLYIEVISGVRFVEIENLFQQSNKDFLVSLGWKPEDFKPIKYSSIGEKIFGGEENEQMLVNLLDKLKQYVSLSLSTESLAIYKKSILNLSIPPEFSFYGRIHLAARALIFRHLDGVPVDDKEYSEWFEKNADMRSNPEDKNGLDRLRDWLKRSNSQLSKD